MTMTSHQPKRPTQVTKPAIDEVNKQMNNRIAAVM
jgi:hypothetical protein